MKGAHAFHPVTGAQLADQEEYVPGDPPGLSWYAADVDAAPPALGDPEADATLTTGALTSSTTALTSYWRRCHARVDWAEPYHPGRGVTPIHRLKSAADGWDVWIWYAAAERLYRDGWAADWMHAFARPRCPACGSALTYVEDVVRGFAAYCGVRCQGRRTDRWHDLDRGAADVDRKTVEGEIKRVYAAAFDPIDEVRVLDPAAALAD